MNDKKEIEIKKELTVKIKGKDKKSVIKLNDKIDIKDKKDGDTVEVKGKIKEEGASGDGVDTTFEGTFKSSYFKDKIVLKKTKDGTPQELDSEQQVWSKMIHKPVLWISVVAVVLLVGGLIWWWIASSKKEDKEEESL